MKNYLFVLALVCGVADVRGAAVTAEANDDNGFSASSMGQLPVGNVVRVGRFSGITEEQIEQSATNPGFLNMHFTEFGRARIGDNGGPGHFSRTINNPNSNAQGFAGQQIYLWVFNSTDPSDANFFQTATEQGVFRMSMTVLPTWKFPNTDDIPNDTTIDLSDLTTADPSVLAPGARILIGQFPYGTSESGAPNFGLVMIPEPTSMALCIVGVFGMASRRRRVV